MAKKRSSGLSKKIPAIFQGVPDIESTSRRASAQEHRAQSGTKKGFGARRAPGTFRILFEVGGSTAKAMGVAKRGGRWTVVECRTFHALTDKQGKVDFKWDELGKWIAETTAEIAGNSSYEARLLLVDSGIYLGETERPDVAAKELKEALIWQVAENLPFPAEESTLRFEEHEDKVLVAAVENVYLETVLKCFHSADVYPAVVTLLPVAYQALNDQYAPITSGNVMVIHISKFRTFILAFRGGVFHSIRELSLGGDHITQAMMGTLVVDANQINIGYDEAQALKESLGLPTHNLMPDPSEPKHSQLSARIRPIFEKMASEFRSSSTQFEQAIGGEKVESIFLAGGGAEMNGIQEYFSGQLNLPVKNLDLSSVDPSLSTALAGVAGMAFVPENRLNFASTEDRLKPRFEKYRDILKIVMLGIGGLLCLVLLGLGMQIVGKKQELREQHAAFREMGGSDEKLIQLDFMLEKITATKDLRKSVIKPDPPHGTVLRELSHLVMPAMVFREMDFRRAPSPTAQFKGIIQLGPRSPDIILSEFLEGLNKSSVFRDARLTSRSGSEEGTAGELQFNVQTELVVGDES
ncbi:MAG: pilus assembly protein PilM [Candidatus Omnitrophota bacterium]|nr:pilus assembly protein PilM [Candidatus Omnitrophota bacterium]